MWLDDVNITKSINVILISDTLRRMTQKNEFLIVSHFYKVVSSSRLELLMNKSFSFEFQTLIIYRKTVSESLVCEHSIVLNIGRQDFASSF